MRKFIFVCAILSGCSQTFLKEIQNDSICNSQSNYDLFVDRETVLVFADSHGDYIRIRSCPDKIFSINFAQSGIYSGKFPELYKQMRYNSLHGVPPVEVTAKGIFRSLKSSIKPANTFLVTEIISYELNPKPL